MAFSRVSNPLVLLIFSSHLFCATNCLKTAKALIPQTSQMSVKSSNKFILKGLINQVPFKLVFVGLKHLEVAYWLKLAYLTLPCIFQCSIIVPSETGGRPQYVISQFYPSQLFSVMVSQIEVSMLNRREFSMENFLKSLLPCWSNRFFFFSDDYLFYLKLNINTLKVNYMRAVKCGVFQLLTAVNELMSFKRQHDNDCSFRVRSSLLITKIWLNELRWKTWTCPHMTTYR